MRRVSPAPGRQQPDASLHARRARILDGAHLWLTIGPATAGALVTRDQDGDRFVVVRSVSSGPQTLCIPLVALPDAGPGSFPLYFLQGDTELKLVLDDRESVPTKEPDGPEGEWRHRLVVESGTLTVVREPARRSGLVNRLEVNDDGITVRWQMSEPTAELAVVDDDVAVAAVPAQRDGADWCAVLSGDLAVPTGVRLKLHGIGTSPYPLRRQRNVLRKPDASVMLPSVTADGGGRLLLRWSREGDLLVELEDVDT